MYNGTGLQTARGSGTNGHIQNNKFSIKPNTNKPIIETKPFNSNQGVSKKANIDILEHDRKRQIEVQLVELEEKLIDQGFSEEEVAEKLNVARRKLEDVGGATVGALFEKR